MAAIKISDLPSVETPTLSDVLPSVNNGETKKITLEQIKNLAGGGSGGTSNYEDLTNKPKINDVELIGNKSLSDLSIQSTSNLVTNLSSSSTDKQYPSAKCVYELVGNVESVLQTINSGSGV